MPASCAACGSMFWANAKPCAGTLITRDGQLLLLRRAIEPWFGFWDIPGGYCDATEHPADCAVREAREETGLDVHLTGLLGHWIDSYAVSPHDDSVSDDPFATPVVCLNIYFTAVVNGDAEPRPDGSEVDGYRWFAPDELPYSEISFPGHCVDVLQAWQNQRIIGNGVWSPWDRARNHLGSGNPAHAR